MEIINDKTSDKNTSTIKRTSKRSKVCPFPACFFALKTVLFMLRKSIIEVFLMCWSNHCKLYFQSIPQKPLWPGCGPRLASGCNPGQFLDSMLVQQQGDVQLLHLVRLGQFGTVSHFLTFCTCTSWRCNLQVRVTSALVEPQAGDPVWGGREGVAALPFSPGHWVTYLRVRHQGVWWRVDSGGRSTVVQANVLHH